jgi:hypothetical protein
MNIVIVPSESGGEFICKPEDLCHVIFQTKNIKLFRPDLCEHSVAEIKGGTRYVLSIGWVLP